MEFSNKEVKRTIRDFNSSIDNLIEANHTTYDVRAREFINEIESNQVLRTIIGPYLTKPVDFDAIEGPEKNDWFVFRLPTDTDTQIAYVLQVMKRCAMGEFAMYNYALHIFKHKRLNDNIFDWNNKILNPVLDRLSIKLEDLIEDKVEGQEQISGTTLQIINNGTITAENGNVALGKDITQSIEQGDVSKSIVEKALQDEVISNEQVPQLKEITNQIEIELKKETPSEMVLKRLIKRLYDLGEKALIKVTTGLIKFPVWTSAVNDFLLEL